MVLMGCDALVDSQRIVRRVRVEPTCSFRHEWRATKDVLSGVQDRKS